MNKNNDDDDDKPGLTITLNSNASSAAFLGVGGPREITDPIDIPPYVKGPHGMAWKCDAAVGRAKLKIKPEDDATLVHWVIEAPWAHPIWHSYSLILVHLRPMPDGRKTLMYVDDATHELWLYALNPEIDRNPMVRTGLVEGNFLTPVNYASQFVEVDDALALFRIQQAVQEICNGTLSPDVDFSSMWVDRFGNNMMKDRPNYRKPKER